MVSVSKLKKEFRKQSIGKLDPKREISFYYIYRPTAANDLIRRRKSFYPKHTVGIMILCNVKATARVE